MTTTTLSGFKELDEAIVDRVKQRVEAQASKLSEQINNLQELKIRLKAVHKREKSEKYELHGFMYADGSQFTAEVTDRNLFSALDAVLNKLEQSSG